MSCLHSAACPACASFWLWANTSLLVKQGGVMFLDPEIKHFLPAVTPAPFRSAGCMKSCYHLNSSLPWNKSSSVHTFPASAKVRSWVINSYANKLLTGWSFPYLFLAFMCYSLHGVLWFYSSFLRKKNEVSYLSSYHISRSSLSVARNFVHWCWLVKELFLSHHLVLISASVLAG